MNEPASEARCGAATPNGPCKKWPMRGKARCFKHGGKAGRPVIHGRRCRFQETLGAAYRRQRDDPDLLRFEAGIAALCVRQEELAQRLASGDGPDFRETAMEHVRELERARDSQDAKALNRALEALKRHIRAGHSRDAAWEALSENISRQLGHVKQALDAYNKAEHVVTAARMVEVLSSMVEILYRELGERDGARFAQMFDREIIEGRLGESQEPPALPKGSGEG